MNRFERHPIISIILAVLLSTLMLDFIAANTYTLIHGYPWAERQDEVKMIGLRKDLYVVPLPIFDHGFEKNTHFEKLRRHGPAYEMFTNSLGFKDRSIRNIPISSNNRRILFIGDSFTEGVGFAYDDTFVGLIDKELSKKNIEVFNAGVISYCPSIYWRKIKYLIEDVGLKFDEVVVFLDISDIMDEALYYCVDDDGNIARKFMGNATILGLDSYESKLSTKIFKNAKMLLRNNSIIIHSVLSNLANLYFSAKNIIYKKPDDIKLMDHTQKGHWTYDKADYKAFGEKGLKKCDFYMDKLYQMLKQNNISLTVAVYPWPNQIIYDKEDSIQVKYWKNWCAQRQVRFINYFPYLMTGKNDKEKWGVINKYYLKNDVHFNKEGNKFIAKIFCDDFNR